MLDFSRVWLPFIYLYGVGGFGFLVGMYLITKSNALNLSNQKHKKWLLILIFGFIYYAGIHSVFILLALGS
ncbi:MAG: hypothetical protein CBC06_008425 [bacterium TMED46]|nr:MAG: hypothetical protein CBC06_008425 [bacterium TMED46]